MVTLEQILASMPEAERIKVKARADELFAEEISLQSLRKARQLTQSALADQLGIKQENVSRIEKRTDILLSTLTKYVEGMGGKLRLVAEFPDSPPITLAGIQDLDDGLTDEERSALPVSESQNLTATAA